jgi:hypothetical protein
MPLSEAATDRDTVELIMKQLPVLDGLVLARTSKVWREASCDIWGYARKYAASCPEFDILSKSAISPSTAAARKQTETESSWLCRSLLAAVESAAEFSSEADRLATELAEQIEAEESPDRLLAEERDWRLDIRAHILQHLEALSISRNYAGPVTKLTGLGWEEMRALSNARLSS